MGKALRLALKVLLAIPLAVLGLGSFVWLALQVGLVRAAILDRVLPLAGASLEGTLEVADVRWPRADRIELRGVTLRDRHGARAAAVERASLNLRLSALLAGQVTVSRVEVDRLFVALDLSDRQRGLLSMFASDGPEPPEPAAPRALSPIAIEVESLCVRDGQVQLRAAPSRRFELRPLDACVRLHVADSFGLSLRRVSGVLSHEGQAVLAIGHAQAQLARAELAGSLTAGGTAELRFDGRLVATAISKQTLEAAGVPVEWLRAKIATDVKVRGRGDAIDAQVELAAADGGARIQAAFDPQQILKVQLTTERLDLRELTTFDLEPIAISASGRAELGQAAFPIRLHVPGGRYGDLPLPQLTARAQIQGDGRVLLQRATVRYGAAELEARGSVETSGAIHAEAELDVPALGALPPLERALAQLGGALTARATFDIAAGGSVSVEGRLMLRDGQYQEQRVQQLKAELEARHLTTAPELDVKVHATELQAAGQHFAHLSLGVEGGPDRFRIRARARGAQQLDVRGVIARDERGWRSPWLRASAALAQGKLTARMGGVRFVPGERLRVSSLAAEFLGARLHGSGSLALDRQHVNATLSARAADLRELTRVLAGSAAPGQLSAKLELEGPLARPSLAVRANYWDGPRFAGSRGRAALDAEVNLARGRARAALEVGAGPARGALSVESQWARGRPLSAALRSGRHTVGARVSNVSFSALRRVPALASAPALRGTLATELHAEGNLERLRASSRSQIDLQPEAGGSPVRLTVDAGYGDARLTLEANARDGQGQIVRVAGALDARLEPLLENPESPAELIAGHRWNMALDVARRRLWRWPGASQLGITKALAPVAVSAKGRVTHEPHAEPEGELDATVAWIPNAAPASHAGCSDTHSAQLRASAVLGGGSVRLQVQGEANQRAVLRADTSVRMRMSEWARGSSLAMIPSHARAKLEALDLAQLPYVCDRARGVVSGSIEARDLFDPRAHVDARLRAERVRWQESPPLSGAVRVHAEPDGLALASQLRPGGGVAEISARLPIQFRVRDPALCVDRSAPLQARTHFRHVDIAAIAGFLPGIARASGTLDGQVALRGTLDAPRADGRLELNDASFTLPRQGQRFSRIHAIAVLDGRTLRLSEVEVHDRGGVARVAASFTLESLEAWTAEVDLRAENFPVRRTGILLGRIDADAKAHARSTPERLSVDVSLRNTDVVLSGNTGAEVQSLERHPDIVFASELRQAEALDAEPEADEVEINAALRLRTVEPIWVRRDDFAVQMRADLKVDLVGEQTLMRGEVELLRGYVSLLGQSFDIERGRVVFTGGERIDPQLEITATQTTPGGVEVRLEVTGFVQKPELAFFVADESVTAGEALAALTGGRDEGDATTASAQEELTSAAIGMTTGFLSLAARREFGDWVPMFAIEAGAQTRVRVGFDADELIPGFLSGFVRGAYVEGIVAQEETASGTSRNASDSRASPGGGGVLLELLLPANFVWVAQYGPGNTWSVDLNWRP